MMDHLKVSVSGVRGIVGQTFTPEIACSFAQAFGTFVGKGPVVVGRDTRPSGQVLEPAVVAGLLSVGCTPVCVGVAPTPSILYATRRSGARGGIAITASHNPAEWNALKFADRNGMFLDAVHAEELFDVYHQRTFPTVDEKDLTEIQFQSDVTRRHFKKIIKVMDQEAIRKRKLKVAVDCCNGVGALSSRSFLENLGADVYAIHENPSGLFERNPEPRPENLSALCEVVRTEGCDIGFAQDPDGDRLAAVDEHGNPIGEDLTVGLAALQVMLHHEKGPAVFNQSISKSVEEKLISMGCEVRLTPTGEINVCRGIIDHDAVVGGESSGGIILPEVHTCRDSYSGMALLMELLSKSSKTISQWTAEFPTYVGIKKKFPIQSSQATQVLRYVRKQFPAEKISLIDGIYGDLGDRWFQIRRSNTESVLRLAVEAQTEDQAQALCISLEEMISNALGQ